MRADLIAREKRLNEIRKRYEQAKKKSCMTGFNNILDAQHHLDIVNTQTFIDCEFLLETIDRYDAICTDLLGVIGP